MKKLFFFIGLEIVLITCLSFIIVNKYQKKIVLPKNDNLKKQPSNKYKNYYEPGIGRYIELVPWENNAPLIHKINSDTIRADKDYSLKKENNTIRLMCLGDSFTFGQFAKDNETYPFQLENILNKNNLSKKKVEVINLGVSGFDSQYSVERYDLRGKKYNPDYVIWFLTRDDFTNIAEPELEITYYYQKNLSLAERKIYIKLLGDSPTLEYSIGSYEVLKKLTYKGILKYNLKVIDQFASKLKNKLIIITFPFIDQYKRDQLRLICKKQNCFVFDKLPNIYRNKKLHFPDLHPNKEGNRKIVEALSKEILTKIK